MALTIAMTGSGAVGPVEPGWRVTEQCTPVALGDTSGGTSSASFKAQALSSSRYVQDNYISLTHPTAGTFQGRVSSSPVAGLHVSPEVNGGLSFLVADRTMPPVWLDNTADRQFVTYGSGTGQVASVYGIATDPFDDGVFVTSYGTVNGIDRYKIIKFSSAGVYISEFGANGSGNGQFAGPMAVAVSPVDGSVYVSDGTQTRITKFTTADRITYTYSTKWGSSGSGDGAFGSSPALNIAVDSSGNVFVADRGNTRLQKFNSSGTFQAKVTTPGLAGGFSPYDVDVDSSGNVYASILISLNVGQAGSIAKYNNTLSSLTSTTTITAPANTQDGITSFAIDSTGNIWGYWPLSTFLVKYDSSGNELFRWQSTYPVPNVQNSTINLAINSAGAVLAIFRPDTNFQIPLTGNYVTEFNYIAVTLSTMLQRYMAACDSGLNGFTFSYTASSNPNVLVPGWTGDVWTKLKELCCVFALEIALVGTVITVRDAGSLTLSIRNASPKTTTPSNSFGGQEVDLTYQQPVAGGGVMYSAAAAGAVWSVDVGQRVQVTVAGNTYPTALAAPTPTDTLPIQAGQYYVVDTAGLPVPAATWTAAGAQILAGVNATPGSIDLTFIGPTATISGFTGPFYFATDRTATATPALSIAGPGLVCTPATINLLTGADPARTTQQIAYSSTSPFLDTATRCYDRGVWSSDYFASPSVDIEFDLPTADTNGFGQTAGSTFALEGSVYRVAQADFGNLTTHIRATRFATLAAVDTAWSGQALSAYDTFWSGYSAGDQQIQPLLTAR